MWLDDAVKCGGTEHKVRERQVRRAWCVRHLHHCWDVDPHWRCLFCATGLICWRSHASRCSLQTPHTHASHWLTTFLGLKHPEQHKNATRKHSALVNRFRIVEAGHCHAESAWKRVTLIPPWPRVTPECHPQTKARATLSVSPSATCTSSIALSCERRRQCMITGTSTTVVNCTSKSLS